MKTMVRILAAGLLLGGCAGVRLEPTDLVKPNTRWVTVNDLQGGHAESYIVTVGH